MNGKIINNLYAIFAFLFYTNFFLAQNIRVKYEYKIDKES